MLGIKTICVTTYTYLYRKNGFAEVSKKLANIKDINS